MTKGHEPDCTLARDAAVDAVRERVAVLQEHIAPCREEDFDGIHDLRVASRRLRAALKAHKKTLPKLLRKTFAKRIKKVTQGLGTARELDVCIALLKTQNDALSGTAGEAATFVLGVLRRERAAQSASIGVAVAAVDTPELERQMAELLDAATPTRACYLEKLEKDLTAKYENILDAYKAWQDAPSDDSLHQVRIQCKKFRYACELAGRQYGPGMDKFTGKLKKAQSLLGDWNDMRVLRNYVEATKHEAPAELAEPVDELYGHLDAQAGELLAGFKKEAGATFTKEAKRRAERLFAKPETACCREKRREKGSH